MRDTNEFIISDGRSEQTTFRRRDDVVSLSPLFANLMLRRDTRCISTWRDGRRVLISR
jgi:hypothetical protein